MLTALQLVLPAVGSKKLSQYFVIRNGYVTAFNGQEVMKAQVPCALNFAPKAKAFYRAIKKAKGVVQFWQGSDGNITIVADNLHETVACEPLDKFPMDIQTGFWFDQPKPRKPKAPKSVPPEPVWLKPGYLPGIEEARAFKLPMFASKEEVIAACNNKEPLLTDIESFGNYFLIVFASAVSGKRMYFEGHGEAGTLQDLEFVKWVANHFLLVTFNGINYDIPILALALAGKTCAQIKAAGDRIIQDQVKHWHVLRALKVKGLKLNHIDLCEVLPLDGSLKLYGGRLHTPNMQDLPYPPSRILTDDEKTVVRWYCSARDIQSTGFAWVALKEQISIRHEMSERYGVDLRSKSDAQVAEAVIKGEITRRTFGEVHKVEVAPGTKYKYQKPEYIHYKTPMMQRFLADLLTWEFWVNLSGYVELPHVPNAKGELSVITPSLNIAGKTYTVGMGGLHSNEKICATVASPDCLIFDRDVASYYPQIILNLGLYPKHLGTAFLDVYRDIVNTRLEAKRAKNKILAEMLKIVVNGSFGKLGSMFSVLYSPDLMMAVTITGQLTLLMLIERLELAGISVISANTDGVTYKCHPSQTGTALAIVAEWERETGFTTEETKYKGLYSRDVNNYIAVKEDGKTKCKGAYLNPWLLINPGDAYERMKKNPHGVISIEAAIAKLVHGTPIATTVRAATDPRKFVAIRTVKGGGVKDGQYLGKTIRWYYKAGETGCIVYALSGNKVAETDGAWPYMDLTDALPADVDFAYYERKAQEILEEIGACLPTGL